jgi:hypothetical protein
MLHSTPLWNAGRGHSAGFGSEVPATEKIVVYPNPVQDKFYIRLPEQGRPAHFHIYDAKGAIVTSGNMENTMYEGSLRGLPPANIISLFITSRAVNPLKSLKSNDCNDYS